jgi:hypothetical protein
LRVRHDWSGALAEHDRVLAQFVQAVAQVSAAKWAESEAPGRWSVAQVVLHVIASYQFGLDAARGGAGMRMRTARPVAWFARTVLLPRVLANERFPLGARAPAEVWPDAEAARSLTVADAIARLERVAGECVEALRYAGESTPRVRVTHAYFGPLRPYEALRLLSAHTRHHGGGVVAG